MRTGILNRIGVISVAGVAPLAAYAVGETFLDVVAPVTGTVTVMGAVAFFKYLFGEAREERAYRRLLTDVRREALRWNSENKLTDLWEGGV